ncbi:MAG: hypothetical protein AAF570_26685 [Bacteroidota bacterium]
MTNLSEYGGGNYYFIESADKIPEMFANELEGLLAVVAQRTKLTIRFPKDQVSNPKVYGYLFDVQDNEITIDFNDLYSEEERGIAIGFDLKPNAQGDIAFDATLRYEDVVETLDKVDVHHQILVRPAPDAETFKAGLNVRALDNIAQFVGNDLLEKAIAAMDKRDVATAKQHLAAAKAYLEGIFKVLQPSEGLQTLNRLIREYEGKLEYLASAPKREVAMAQKMSKSASYYYRNRK